MPQLNARALFCGAELIVSEFLPPSWAPEIKDLSDLVNETSGRPYLIVTPEQYERIVEWCLGSGSFVGVQNADPQR